MMPPLLAAVLAAAQVTLPANTVVVKFRHARIIALESKDKDGWLTVRDSSGKPLRRIQAGAGLAGLRRVEVKDYDMQADGTLAVSLGAQFSMGATSRLLAIYPERGEPRFVTLDDVVCYRVAAEAGSGLWCLGPGLEDSLLHRVSGPAEGPWSLLARKHVPIVPNDAGESREAYETGQSGVPSLFAGPPGRLFAWLPNAGALYEADVAAKTAAAYPTPQARGGRSQISMMATPGTATAGGGVYALMPLRRPSQREQFGTQYGVYRLDRATSSWIAEPRYGVLPRGSVLAGTDGETLVIWLHRDRRLEWRR